ncbi:hypothetical protein EVAR_35547_1 [Eumeta japonica]|uniref:Uncharacterized protein n=1 Tax=Eumeta variegata TaxID=151549 RepID=A0A4C1X4V9_EUMVA|nr:hypothetical protein EVAR_35547_1 [Eumeta japonica]
MINDSYVDKLRSIIEKKNRPQLFTVHHNSRRIFVHKDLQACSHVFIRIDAEKKSLQVAYLLLDEENTAVHTRNTLPRVNTETPDRDPVISPNNTTLLKRTRAGACQAAGAETIEYKQNNQ